jgi:hypothetical protein
MTIHNLRTQMTIAIAEIIGWQIKPDGLPAGIPPEALPENQTVFDRLPIPQFTSSLDAMAVAEKWLHGTPEQYHRNMVVHRRWREYQHLILQRWGVSASAMARAWEFLQVMNPQFFTDEVRSTADRNRTALFEQ